MLLIRDSQMRTIENELRRRLRQRLMEQIIRYYPETTRRLGDNLEEAVARCISTARSHGFQSEREICKYLNLTFRFGREFEADPRCAWAHAILRSALPAPAKMKRLYALALEHEAEAQGYFAQKGGDRA